MKIAETLNRIGNLWGEVLCLTDETVNQLSFDCARIKVATRHIEVIDRVIFLQWNGRSIPVRVQDEPYDHLSLNWCQKKFQGTEGISVGND